LPYVGIKHDNLKFGFIESFNNLKFVDDQTKDLTPCKIAFLSFFEEVEFDRTDNLRGESSGTSHSNQVEPDLYWDIFISRCIKECANLIQKNWILKDDVESVDPSIVMSVPAVAALSILTDSAKSDNEDKEAIVWAEGVVCTSSSRPRQDNIVNLLWPRVMEIKKTLKKNPALLEEGNVDIITANICSNQDVQTDELNAFLEGLEDNNSTLNNHIRSKLIDLSLSLSRVRPMSDRLNKIISHDYEDV